MIQFVCGLIIGELVGSIVTLFYVFDHPFYVIDDEYSDDDSVDDEYSDYEFEDVCIGESAECLDCDFWSDCREEYE